MKKSIMLMLALTAIICSCGESDSTQNTQHDIWVMQFVRYSTTSRKILIYNFSRILYISVYNFLKKLYF